MASSDSERAPLIGITTYLERAQQGVWDVRAAFLPEQYLTGVTAAGGIALLLPPQDAAGADAAIGGLDALILSGGADVAPELYGADRHPLTDPPRTDRDAWELALFRAAERRGMPVLAICRGLQLVNVARGGTLQQHLPESLGTERYRIGGGIFAETEVAIDGDTALGAVLGDDSVQVRSYHHQGIDRLGAGLTAAARSDDGLVQAVVDTEHGHLVGIQWHPEEDADDRRLFEDLVAQARAFAGEQHTAEQKAGTR